MLSLRLLASAAAVLALGAGTASADPLPTTAYYFSCAGDQKYQGDQAPAWSTTKPSASFQSGAGCGNLDLGVLDELGGQRLAFAGGGSHTGPIESVTVDLYSLVTSQVRAPADYPGVFDLIIDGESVLSDQTLRIAGDKTANNGLTEHLVFSFAHPAPVDEETGEETGGPRDPLAGPGSHTVEVHFSSRTVEYQNLWVWGASEVPAGVTINAPELRGVKIVG
jgi:hypothetical protein